jgi:hypothetical protein
MGSFGVGEKKLFCVFGKRRRMSVCEKN